MTSIFDSIRVPETSLDVTGSSGASPPAIGGGPGGVAGGNGSAYASPTSALSGWTPPATSPAAAAGVASSQGATVGMTGLVASMEPAEFTKLVREADSGTVLRTAVQMAGQQRSGSGSPVISRRYIFPFQGIVFATLSQSQLDLGARVRVVDCLAVAYEGKPLGGGNTI